MTWLDVSTVPPCKGLVSIVAKEGLYENWTYQKGIPEGEGYTCSYGTGSNDKYGKYLPGTYTATVTLEDGYVWSDNTTDPLTVSWTINEAKAIAKPAVENNGGYFYYDGDEHGLKITQNGSAEIEGLQFTRDEPTAAAVGYYQVDIKPAYGYKWENASYNAAFSSMGTYTYEIAPIKAAVSAGTLVMGVDDSQTADLPITCWKTASTNGSVVVTADEVAALGITTKGVAADRILTAVSGSSFTLPDDAVYVGGFNFELSDDALPVVDNYNIFIDREGWIRACDLARSANRECRSAGLSDR